MTGLRRAREREKSGERFRDPGRGRGVNEKKSSSRVYLPSLPRRRLFVLFRSTSFFLPDSVASFLSSLRDYLISDRPKSRSRPFSTSYIYLSALTYFRLPLSLNSGSLAPAPYVRLSRPPSFSFSLRLYRAYLRYS